MEACQKLGPKSAHSAQGQLNWALTMHTPFKVAVVGAGNVGASFAYALLLSGVASEIVLVDANHSKAEGEAMDLAHGAPFAFDTRVRAGDYAEIAGAAVTVVTAGANQKPGEPRLDLARKNAGIFRQIIPAVAGANPDGLIVVATNPVDVMTQLSAQLAGMAPGRVFGSGTILDTARFRHFIGAHLGVAARSVSAYIIGEHGDSELPIWSAVTIGGMPLRDYCAARGIALTDQDKTSIFERTRDAAYHIIERKGATHFAIGAGLVEVVAAIARDENAILPVGGAIDNYNGLSDITFGMPRVVGRGGAGAIVPLALDETESKMLAQSVQALRNSLEVIKNE